MNKKLVAYLDENRTRLPAEWRSRFVANTSRAGLEAGDIPAKMIGEFYSELMSLLQGGHMAEIGPHFEGLPHHAANGFRLSLSCLLELLLSGEELIRDDLLLDKAVPFAFSPAEAMAGFGSVNRAIHELIHHHAATFCKECCKPVEDADWRLIMLSDALREQGGKVYDSK